MTEPDDSGKSRDLVRARSAASDFFHFAPVSIASSRRPCRWKRHHGPVMRRVSERLGKRDLECDGMYRLDRLRPRNVRQRRRKPDERPQLHSLRVRHLLDGKQPIELLAGGRVQRRHRTAGAGNVSERRRVRPLRPRLVLCRRACSRTALPCGHVGRRSNSCNCMHPAHILCSWSVHETPTGAVAATLTVAQQ